jgi:predicted RNase H-like HicB family nuclease
MTKHRVVLYWSQADSLFVAEAPELPGCMAHGPSQEAALENIRQAMELWVDTARELGEPIPEPKGEGLTLV